MRVRLSLLKGSLVKANDEASAADKMDEDELIGQIT